MLASEHEKLKPRGSERFYYATQCFKMIITIFAEATFLMCVG